MKGDALKEYLDFKADQFNCPDFIADDPIQLPHRFTRKEDIEIVGLLVSTIAWGKRQMIIKSGEHLLGEMGESPYDYVRSYRALSKPFVHRTFQAEDLDFFFRALRAIYEDGDLEKAFAADSAHPGAKGRIISFRTKMLQTPHAVRARKHLSDPLSNSAAKRLNMYLRWMVRNDKRGVDFGIWPSISPSELCIPLDVHTARVSRELGLLKRKQNDWQALEEIMGTLRSFDPVDPAKYDFALFGIGAMKEI
jgi:uncharacterized protein (TIGR02757 family)